MSEITREELDAKVEKARGMLTAKINIAKACWRPRTADGCQVILDTLTLQQAELDRLRTGE